LFVCGDKEDLQVKDWNPLTDLPPSLNWSRNDERLKKLFHELWGKAKENPDYDRHEWNELQFRLMDLGVNV